MAKESLRPLTSQELYDLLGVSEGVVLVAGQALATWADLYEIVPPSALEMGVTYDIDFLGTATQASDHASGLAVQFRDQVEFIEASIDDPTPNSAVILLKDLNGRTEPIIIDYLRALQGYTAQDEEKLRAIAVRATIWGRDVLIMHPFDCLKSRLHNVATLPSKQNEMGYAQLRLAIRVLSAHLKSECEEGNERNVALPLAERVISLASSPHGLNIWHGQGIDLLEAIPVDSYCPAFQQERWPRALAAVAEKRERRLRAIHGGRRDGN
ncbi:hypothetical protein [Agrilutibacter solisilvae]|uniref:Uncharacterized protein n=1 Tax=Agrilutibacter solisilvae TaxID=2763317 RepID=A0A974XZK0_9GAMM|nr:hypothetical protein [Lysobacter solisilvae]QSX77808.1 hypothetical protein I8J32_013905 [Lysobacter solisilvae]